MGELHHYIIFFEKINGKAQVLSVAHDWDL